MMLHSINSLIDRAFIGDAVGEVGLAGISVSFPLFILLMGGTLGIGSGMAAAVSIALGSSDRMGLKRILISGMMILGLVLPVLGLLTYPFLDSLLWAAGASSKTLPYAREYIVPLIFGYLPWAIGGGLAEVIRAQGFPRYALLVTAASPVVNILLDPLFIYTFDMGMRGAGLATVAGYTASTALAIGFYARHFSEPGGRPLPGETLPSYLDSDIWAPTKRILFLGLPAFLLQAGSAIYGALLNLQLLAYGGDNAVAIMSVVFSVTTLVLLPVVGIGQGMQPIVGYNQGAGRFNRVRAAWLTATALATLVTLGGFAVAMLIPGTIFRLFGTSPEFIDQGKIAMRVTFTLMPLVGFQIIAASYFQAVGKAHKAIVLAVSRQVIILPVLLYTLPVFYGLNGVWAVSAVSDLLSTLLAIPLLIWEFRHPGLAHIFRTTLSYVPGSFRSRG